MSPVSPPRTLPGGWGKESQTDGPRPPAAAAPSIWYAAEPDPQVKPAGKDSKPLAACLSGGPSMLCVAVVGFDDIFPGSLCDPLLTTVHQPMRLLGARACTRLLDRIARPSLRQKVEMLPTELVLRSSC